MARRRAELVLCPRRSYVWAADAERRWLRAFRLLLDSDRAVEYEHGEAEVADDDGGIGSRGVRAGVDGAPGGGTDD